MVVATLLPHWIEFWAWSDHHLLVALVILVWLEL
jgi:hypothetical protein